MSGCGNEEMSSPNGYSPGCHVFPERYEDEGRTNMVVNSSIFEGGLFS
jgi:hypothetical protein